MQPTAVQKAPSGRDMGLSGEQQLLSRTHLDGTVDQLWRRPIRLHNSLDVQTSIGATTLHGHAACNLGARPRNDGIKDVGIDVCRLFWRWSHWRR